MATRIAWATRAVAGAWGAPALTTTLRAAPRVPPAWAVGAGPRTGLRVRQSIVFAALVSVFAAARIPCRVCATRSRLSVGLSRHLVAPMAASGDSGTASSAIVYTHGALGAPSVSLAAMLKAVVFDFDLTVLRIHSYADRIEPEMIAHREWQKDFADLESFKAICEQLVALKVRVAIASFGRKDVITEYLKLAFGDRFSDIFPEEAICTPADVGSIDGHALPDGKNTQIKTILASMGLTDDDRGVLFFDGEECCRPCCVSPAVVPAAAACKHASPGP